MTKCGQDPVIRHSSLSDTSDCPIVFFLPAMRRALYCLALVLLFGVVRLPFERQVTRNLHAAHFLQYQLNLNVRTQAKQMGFVAALSGYRAVVADYMWIEAYTAWSHTEWGRLKLLLDATTSLQPRAVTFWDISAWHMAWNASTNARENRKEPNQRLRLKAEREYILIGEQYLLDGLKYNPESGKLWESLGALHVQKMHDPCRGTQDYAMAAKQPDAFPYMRRMAAYYLAQCPGHEREALDELVRLFYLSEDERLPTLLKTLDRLQKQLGVPAEQQIDITEELKKATPR